MLRRIDISDLKIGMYVQEVDRRWLDIPFFRRKITAADQIQKLRRYNVHKLSIDTERGIDVGVDPGSAVAVATVDSESVVEEVPDERPRPVGLTATTEFHEELGPATAAYGQAVAAVRDLLQDLHAGRQVREQTVEAVVSDLVDSVIRNDDALASLTKLLAQEEYLMSHCVNVTVFTLVLAKALGFREEELLCLGKSAFLHDVGKMLIPREILHKSGKLSPEEFDVMKLHVERGVAYLRDCFPDRDFLWLVALDHHERLDGSGYPHGKRGDEISLWGRIAAIADTYDALTARRCYCGPMTPHQAVSLLYHLGGDEFEPLFVERFIEAIGIYPIGSLVRLNTKEIGLVVRVCHEDLLRPDVLLLYQGGRRLVRPRQVSLRHRGGPGARARRIEAALHHDDYGVDPAKHILRL